MTDLEIPSYGMAKWNPVVQIKNAMHKKDKSHQLTIAFTQDPDTTHHQKAQAKEEDGSITENS